MTMPNETVKAAAGGLPFDSPEDWKNFFEKFGANGRTYQDFTNLTPQSMEVIYMVGYNQYNAGKYDEAERIFQLLSVLNHFERRYWTGLAASRELQKKYDLAIKAYGYLAMLDMEDPLPPLMMAKCFLAAGKVADAEGALHACVFVSGKKPQHAAIVEQAENLLELLSKNENAGVRP
ncbi:type III secretion system low calcium response chaperone LcrH/SycD [Prosthecobacter fusiformis]|uniref:Type III secretion system low calcium response chaperone LcrH/SycD n=1 Tax=Prosthecobacter fusiformis TaxID=48464 RepID=A0A4R7S175_9BACT|nr:SycD/LcrH family type III secretion system chaperone [Prosthecobacter fusiformis]TDU70717.1 type III secretion system low calcium response chaperone LcrH/SycD [Prosthecobacter fusiformis]